MRSKLLWLPMLGWLILGQTALEAGKLGLPMPNAHDPYLRLGLDPNALEWNKPAKALSYLNQAYRRVAAFRGPLEFSDAEVSRLHEAYATLRLRHRPAPLPRPVWARDHARRMEKSFLKKFILAKALHPHGSDLSEDRLYIQAFLSTLDEFRDLFSVNAFIQEHSVALFVRGATVEDLNKILENVNPKTGATKLKDEIIKEALATAYTKDRYFEFLLVAEKQLITERESGVHLSSLQDFYRHVELGMRRFEKDLPKNYCLSEYLESRLPENSPLRLHCEALLKDAVHIPKKQSQEN